jgi:hypothetical protein
MRISIRVLLVILTLVASLITVQAAWSDIVDEYSVTGTVYECVPGTSGIQIDTGEEIIGVFGMGPSSYWATEGVDFPEVGDKITIWVYEVLFSDDTIKLVAASVDLWGDGSIDIFLRDDDGVPLWRQKAKGLSQASGSR